MKTYVPESLDGWVRIDYRDGRVGYVPDEQRSFREAWRHFKNGVRFRHPLCCTLHFALDHLLHDNALPACRRGGLHSDRAGVYVACGLCERRHRDRIDPPAGEVVA